MMIMILQLTFSSSEKRLPMNNAFNIVMDNRKDLVKLLIDQMENGTAATRAAWYNPLGSSPYNPVSNIHYRGGNRFRLMLAAAINDYSDPRWMTFKQASDNNYKILPGSKGILLEKWIFYKTEPLLDENKNPIIDLASGKPVTQQVPLENPCVNYFRVFNAAQISGLPVLSLPELTKDAIYETETRFIASSKCPIYHENINSSYYSPSEDAIHLPPKEAFKSNESRLSVLLHEMAHSTGHPDRLNRNIQNRFGSIDYAIEELNAEISSLFLGSDLGLPLEYDSELMADHANYVTSWISILKNDPNELFRACATADKISSYLMDNYEKSLVLSKDQNLEKHVDYDEQLTHSFYKNHLKPTETVLHSINKLNQLTNTQNSLKDICNMYKNPDLAQTAEARSLINSIGNELKLQEVHMQQIQQIGMEI